MKSWTEDSKRLESRREAVNRGAGKRLVCQIRGTVRGVGFRWSVQGLAERLGITGYVRNTDNGHVEVVAEGSADALETLRAFCYRGPDGATVTGVHVIEGPATGEFNRFEIV